MEVVALCPFTVGTVVWQPQAGAWTLTACVKGTFKLEHGKDPTLDETQEQVSDDRFHPDPARGSLYAPSDLVPFKPRGDVTAVGHAYAPGGRPVDALVARLCVGELDKALGVVGNRIWKEGPDGLEPSAPEPFVKMPLRYERATRGPDNPVGLDLAAAPVAGALALPNLEPVEDEAGLGRTVGFGPLAASWRPRKDLLGNASPPAGANRPMPPGFDFAYFNAAPRDQQVDLLRANAKVLLENLHPRHARLETRIPAVRPKAFLVDTRGKATEIALRCDTIWIDTDRATMALTWRGLTGIESVEDAALGTLVVAVESRGKEIRYKLIENLFREGALASLGTDDLATEEKNPMSIRHDSVKPSAPPPALVPRSPAERPRRDRGDSTRATSPEADAAHEHAAPALPAVPPAPRIPSVPSQSQPARPRRDDATQTDVTTDKMARDAVSSSPAAGGTAPPRNASKPDVRATGGAARPPQASATDVEARVPPATLGDSRPGEMEGDEAHQTERTEVPVVPDGRAAPVAAASAPAAASAGEAGQRGEPGNAPEIGWRDVSGHLAPESPRSGRAPDPSADLDAYAEIVAELGSDTGPRQSVLASHGLSEEKWRQAEQRWTSSVHGEGATGSAERLELACAAARERLRAAASVRINDYVKVVMAAEKGSAERALAEIGLGPRDLPLLQRVWRRRAATEPEVARAIAEALDPERKT